MRVLGIDPGSRRTGFGCVELVASRRPAMLPGRVRNAVSPRGVGRIALFGAGVLESGGARASWTSRLETLSAGLDSLLDRFEPDICALEEAYVGRSVQSALRLGEVRGVLLLGVARRGIRIAQYAPATVKLRVAGRGSASKEALGRMVARELGEAASRLEADASDAIAIALCHVHSLARELGQKNT